MHKRGNKGKRIVLFGGTFDPPHTGHVAFCRALVDDPSFDEVWILPSFKHPFGKEAAPFKHRLAMCSAAFEDLGPKLKVRDDESKVGGDGFTVDLLRFLRSRYPTYAFTLALGADNYSQRHRWQDFDTAKKIAEVRFYGRRGWEAETEHLGLDTPFPKVSSQEIREIIKSGDIPSELLPRAVYEYIQEHKLYFP